MPSFSTPTVFSAKACGVFTLTVSLLLLTACTSDPTMWRESLFAEGFSQGLGKARAEGVWGYVDKTGTFVIAPKYLSVTSFKDGFAAVKKRKGFGFIDLKGKPFEPIDNPFAFPFINGRAAFLQHTSRGFKWGFLDLEGFPVIPPTFDRTQSFSESGHAAVRKNNNWGFIDRSGKVVVPFKYRAARHFSEGLAPVNLKGQWGYVNDEGDMVIPPAFDDAYPFSEGIAAVLKSGRWGFITTQGNWVARPIYVNVSSFSEGLAAVQYINGKWGYVDRDGKFVIHPKYDMAKSFTEGLAAVNEGSSWKPGRHGGWRMVLGGKWGYVDKTGTLVKPLEYVQASPFTDGAARVRIGDKLAYIDKSFKVFWREP